MTYVNEHGDAFEEQPRNHFFPVLLGASLFCWAILLNAYAGDATIYLCYAKNLITGNGLVLNHGEFPSGLTSPLWGLILTLAWTPTMAKVFGVASLVMGLYYGRGVVPDWALAVIAYFAMMFACVFYETGLVVFVSFGALKNKSWAIALLPFVRPEGVLISLWYGRKKLWLLTPIALYWFASWISTGYFSTSAVFRGRWLFTEGGGGWYWKRYAVILLPFLFFYFKPSLPKFVPYVILVLMCVKIYAARDKFYSFDVITAKETVQALNLYAQDGERLLTREVQYRYWLKPSVKILSLDGITDGKLNQEHLMESLQTLKPEWYMPPEHWPELDQLPLKLKSFGRFYRIQW